ncbi:esterase-like activity of phytase family protein [Sphingomonas sp. HITSZ_GF]|uniref:esterase-like activity of phytase family protein n=1 Tax=Sphingomonas sp. HITSZ_GF TaxID=3037247 RepID=UPI00240D2AFE|nr:esterase-like activity of phytase family protein [Sphingomonas sp. HITSZ_GF]MDG2534596.1 esterase-like activity of phytase family protein [Sphingomonas sp. HITSZ_GF]
MLLRPAIALFSLCLILLLSASGREGRDVLGKVPSMQVERVPLDLRDPARTRVGALTYLGGIRLKSPDRAFGGFSSMQIKGDRFTLLSDGGTFIRFRMGADWAPRELRFGDLPDGPGSGWLKAQRDSESMTSDPATGHIWVGFENYNAIWRYDDGLTRAERSVRPGAMRGWSANGGPESMVRLADGRFVVLSETSRPKGSRTGREALLFAGDPTAPGAEPIRFTYLPPDEAYDPSDAVQLPDGRLIVLNRRFSVPDLFTARLTLVDPRAIRAGAVVKGQEIAALAPPLLHDNYEALAVTREGKDVILWIASDDNQQFWEWSLLLKFRVEFGK